MNRIGKVKIDDRYHSGRDHYSDGDVEDLLLEAMMEGRAAQEVIREHPVWPVFYHLSDLRENILNWIPFQKTDTVLEIGAGCGAVTGALVARCKEVVCVELSKKRSLINAYRHRNADNLEIMIGNFSDVRDRLDRKFDYITLIGVYEYAALYTKEEHPHLAFLQQLKKLLKPEGRLIIAIENRLGLKYFAGCKEDHLGVYFQGIENQYAKGGVRTFGRTEMIRLLEEAGLREYRFYYPYPDYKLAQTIYSDDYLPKKGELVQNIRNFDADRLLLFDESKAWDGIIQAGLFAEFSNSFLVMASSDQTKMFAEAQPEKMVFAKFASERAADYQIVTEMIQYGCCKNDSGQKQGEIVRKRPLTDQAVLHVKKMQESYVKLSALFEETAIDVAACVWKDAHRIEMPFMQGRDLESLLEDYISQQRHEQVFELIQYFFTQFLERVQLILFQQTEAFTEVFGAADEQKICKSLPVTNADCIFSNFIVKEPDSQKQKFVMLDYEWTFDFPVPLAFVLFRALFHSYAFQKLEQTYKNRLFQYAGIKEEDKPFYLNMELAFQQYVRGQRPETEKIYRNMHTHVWDMRQINPKVYYTEYQIYFDGQLGKWEDTLEREVTIHVSVPEGTETIRIVLNDKNGIYKLRSICAQDGCSEIKDYKSNAQLQIFDDFYFTQIPEVEIKNGQYREIIMKYQVLEADSHCMEQMITALKDAEQYRQAYGAAKQDVQAYEKAYHTADCAWKEYEQAYHTADRAWKEYEQAYLESEKKCVEYSHMIEACTEKCCSLEEELKQIHNSLWWKLRSKIGRFKK